MLKNRYYVPDNDLKLVISQREERGLGLSFKDGYRACEAILAPQLEMTIRYSSLDLDAAIKRIELLENIIEGKEKIIRDYRGMIDTSFEVVCKHRELLSEIKTGYETGSDLSLLIQRI